MEHRRSHGEWIAASASAQTEVANPLSLEATDVTRSPFRRTDRNPNQSWRYLRLVGTQSFDLVAPPRAQVAAERLGLPLEQVQVLYGDTLFPGAVLAGGSQQTA